MAMSRAPGASPQPPTQPRRGRRPAATREQVLELVSHHYLRGLRVDVQALSSQLGVGRSTIYRWFGSRDGLIGEAIVRAAEPVLADAHRQARGEGAQRLLETFDRFNRSLAASSALRRFVERERDAALRVITSSAGPVQPRIVAMIQALIMEEVDAGRFRPSIDPQTLGYAIVRLAEAFLYNDAGLGIRGDVERLRAVEAAMLGLPAAGAAGWQA